MQQPGLLCDAGVFAGGREQGVIEVERCSHADENADGICIGQVAPLSAAPNSWPRQNSYPSRDARFAIAPICRSNTRRHAGSGCSAARSFSRQASRSPIGHALVSNGRGLSPRGWRLSRVATVGSGERSRSSLLKKVRLSAPTRHSVARASHRKWRPASFSSRPTIPSTSRVRCCTRMAAGL